MRLECKYLFDLGLSSDIADIWANHATVATVFLKIILYYTMDFGIFTVWVLVHMTFDTLFSL